LWDYTGGEDDMNKQLNRLLMILLNAPGQYHNYDVLAEVLSVSSRSVRNYIQSLTQFMGDIGLVDVLQISEGGITFTGTSKDISRIKGEVIDTEFYLYRLSPEERCVMISLYLLLLDGYCNLLELSEKFNVSRTTALKDMEKVRGYLNRYHLSIDPSLKRGYRLQISEIERREMILNITQNAAGDNSQVNIYKKFLYDEWELESNAVLLKKILLSTEERYGLEVSDVNFDEILLTLQIIVKRLAEGRLAGNGEAQMQTAAFGNPEVYKAASDILQLISSSFPVVINEAEVEFLASRLHSCRFYHRSVIQECRDIRLHLAVTGFLLKIGSELNITLEADQVTAEQLESHLRAIDKAHLEGRQIRNDYTEQMISDYPGYYELICRHRGILESVLEYQYTRDDLAVILIYLVVMAERSPDTGILPEVIVVCHTGIGTANFLAKKLTNNFNIKILMITSNHKLDELADSCKCDLIISTIALEAEPESWIKVSPVLSDEDILKLQKLFMDIRRRKRKSAELKNSGQQENPGKAPGGSVGSILRAEHILPDISCQDWMDAIRCAAKPLHAEGVIENRYIEAMIHSVQVNGAYFVYAPGAALVHAGPMDGVNTFGLTLMRLEPPVEFGHRLHDPVTYVICMAIREKDYRLQIIMKLMDLLSSPSAVAGLNKAKTGAQMLHCLIEEEKKYE